MMTTIMILLGSNTMLMSDRQLATHNRVNVTSIALKMVRSYCLCVMDTSTAMMSYCVQMLCDMLIVVYESAVALLNSLYEITRLLASTR